VPNATISSIDFIQHVRTVFRATKATHMLSRSTTILELSFT